MSASSEFDIEDKDIDLPTFTLPGETKQLNEVKITGRSNSQAKPD
jgi:hypothetical protein